MSQLCSTSVETDALHFMSRRGLQAFKPGLLKHMVVSVRRKKGALLGLKQFCCFQPQPGRVGGHRSPICKTCIGMTRRVHD